MTLEQAIEHAEDIATSAIGCERREEHRQLAALLRELQEIRKDRDYWQEKAHSYEQTICKLTDAISAQPEPKEGYWKKDEKDDCPPVFQQFRICSVCGAIETSETSYCPRCGARMKGVSNERTD